MLANNLVLLIDDEPDILEALSETLTLEGFSVIAERDAQAALPHLSGRFAGVVVSDLRMPGMDGVRLLQHVQGIDPGIPLIIVTGHGDVPRAVEAMRLGAFDFVEKPVDPKYLIAMVLSALAQRRDVLNNRMSAGGAVQRDIETVIIGHSQLIEPLRTRALAIARSDDDASVHSGTGTGKDHAARCLDDCGPRAAAPFVALNCGALPAETIARELFEHEAGAFAGAVKRRIGKIEHAS